MKLFSKRMDKELAVYQQELIETHYQEVDNMYRQIRGWRHDYRNHIQTMKAYAATENWEALTHYLDLLDEDLTTVDTVIKTGNPMTDAILNSKISLAKSKNIQVIADAHIDKIKHLQKLIYAVLSKSFCNNTIDAQSRLPEEHRLIRIYMDVKIRSFIFLFTNFTAEKKMKRIISFAVQRRPDMAFWSGTNWCIVERQEGYISRT